MKKSFSFYLFLLIIGLNATAQTSFTKVTIGSVVNDSSDCIDASWADYDKDGDLDLFVTTNFPSINNPFAKNLLYQNNCNGEFTKVTAIPGEMVNDGNSLESVWIDYDNDGHIDLYVGNTDNNNYLYHNLGDGTFEKITNNEIVLPDINTTWGIAWADYDNDGYVDLFTSSHNSSTSNSLYNNNGDGSFTSITIGDIVNDINIFSGATWADFDNDGDMDMYVTTT